MTHILSLLLKRNKGGVYHHATVHLNIGNGGEVPRLLQAVEPSVFHELAHNLVGNLVAPLVDDGHVDVVNEYGHLLACRRSIR